MVWHPLLLQAESLASLALLPTPVDRIAVWGGLAVVIALIAWREYTLPEVSSSLPVPKAGGD